MINRVVLVGRLTKDPELRYTPSGIATVRFTIAVNRTFTGQSGEKEADFINCVAWRKQAENLANFQKKGNLIGVEGRIQTGSFEGQDGKRVYTTDIVADSIQFLEPRNNRNGEQGETSNSQPQYSGASQQSQSNNQWNGASQQQSYSQSSNSQYGASNNQNYTRIDEDPFSNTNRGPIEVSDNDLPF